MRIWLVQPHEHTPLDPWGRVLRHGQLARRLVQRGVEVTWWTSRFYHHRKTFRAGPERIRTAEGYDIVQLPGPGYRRNVSLRRLAHYRALVSAFRDRVAREEHSPDLIHCALPPLELPEAAVAIARQLGVPSTVDILDTWPDVYLTALARPLRPLLRVALATEFRRSTRALAGATALVGISESYLAWALARARRERGPLDSIFPLGYQPHVPAETGPREPLPVPPAQLERKTVVTFVGSFVSMCDIDVVLDAARDLQNRASDLLFVIAGDGPLGRKWRGKAEGLQNVVFTGWLSQRQVARLLEHSDIGLAPYVAGATQSLPNKIFEYMAAGLPVVSSLRGDAEALLATERIGVTFREGDQEDLVRNLFRLAEDRELRDGCRRRATALFSERFSADSVYQAMASHLIRIAATGGSVPTGSGLDLRLGDPRRIL